MLSATHAAEQRFCGGIIVSLTMSVPSLPDIPRAFAEWSTDRVIEWLTTLQLSNDYSKPFRGSLANSVPSKCNLRNIFTDIGQVM